MFAAVIFEEGKHRFKSFFRPLSVKTERRELPSGGYFFIITAEKRKNKIPLNKIISISGNLRSSMIFPSDFDFTGKEDLIYKPRGLGEKLLFRFAEKNLRLMKLKPSECSLCVNDSSGAYVKDIRRLLPFAAKIYIICSDKCLYEDEVKRIFYEYGCSVILLESFEPVLRNCDVIISYKSDEVPLFFGKHIFTENVISSVSIKLPEEYEALCPEGIDKEVFASALYEKCNVPAEIFLLDNIPCMDIY